MFKVGDKVWDYNYGHGVITDIKNNKIYSVYVKFETGEEMNYYEDGSTTPTRIRTLFFEEIPIPKSALERPRFRAKEGEKYHFVNSYGVVCFTTEHFLEVDNKRFYVENYFETEEEAEESEIYKFFEKLKAK